MYQDYWLPSSFSSMTLEQNGGPYELPQHIGLLNELARLAKPLEYMIRRIRLEITLFFRCFKTFSHYITSSSNYSDSLLINVAAAIQFLFCHTIKMNIQPYGEREYYQLPDGTLYWIEPSRPSTSTPATNSYYGYASLKNSSVC